jgi:signal transduction histidine kinase
VRRQKSTNFQVRTLPIVRRCPKGAAHQLGFWASLHKASVCHPTNAGKLELNPEPVDLARLIDEVIGTAGQLAEKNKNRLIVEAQENLDALNADSMRLKQILLNLLSNACKFTKEGEVALRVRKVADGRPPGASGSRERRPLKSRTNRSRRMCGSRGQFQDGHLS